MGRKYFPYHHEWIDGFAHHINSLIRLFIYLHSCQVFIIPWLLVHDLIEQIHLYVQYLPNDNQQEPTLATSSSSQSLRSLSNTPIPDRNTLLECFAKFVVYIWDFFFS
jgi:hypothetical protein